MTTHYLERHGNKVMTGEDVVYRFLKTKEFKFLSNNKIWEIGFPDFLVKKNNTTFFVEVKDKTTNDKLSIEQIEWFSRNPNGNNIIALVNDSEILPNLPENNNIITNRKIEWYAINIQSLNEYPPSIHHITYINKIFDKRMKTSNKNISNINIAIKLDNNLFEQIKHLIENKLFPNCKYNNITQFVNVATATLLEKEVKP